MTEAFSQSLEIQNQRGLHARAASKFVRLLENYGETKVLVAKDGQEVSGNSIMGLLMLGASIGTSIEVKTEGPEAQAAMDAISELVNDKFGED